MTTWMRTTALAAAGVALAVFAAACLGGQSAQTKKLSDALGDQSGDVPPATLRERNWSEAAKGHGAAGTIPADELARLEKGSAPGGNRSVDAGPGRPGDASARGP